MTYIGILISLGGALNFFSTAFADPYVTPKLFWVYLGALVAMAGVLLQHWKSSESNDHALTPPLLAWWSAMIVCTIFSIDPLISIIGPRPAQFNSILGFAGLSVLAVAVARSNIEQHEVPFIIVICALPGTVYAILQGYVADPLIFWPLPGGRVIGVHGSPVYLGAVLAVGVPAAVYLASCGRSGLERALGVAGFILGLWALFLTQTRGAAIGAAAGVSVQLIIMKPSLARYIIPAGILAALAALGLRDGVGQADSARIEVWKVAFSAFLDRPVFGWGPDNFTLAFRRLLTPAFVAAMASSRQIQYHAHHDILQIAATMGIVGLMAYAFVVRSVYARLKDLSQDWAHSDYAAAVAGTLVALWCAAQFNPVSTASILIAVIILAPAFRTGETTNARPSGGLLVVALVGLGLVNRIVGAEAFERRYVSAVQQGDGTAALRASNKAAQLNPWEPHHTSVQLQMLRAALPSLSPHNARQVLRAGISIAEQNLDRHPQNPDALEELGIMRGVSRFYGLPDEAAAALAHFEAAQKFAPTFSTLVKRRRAFAKALGKKVALARANSDLVRLQTYAGDK